MSRERSTKSLQRREKPVLLEGNLILIVCEGEKTEPNYFKALLKEWRLHPAKITIIGEECASQPISIVDYAIKSQRDNKKKIKYDQIWCVFDHEGIHKPESLDRAVDKARAHQLRVALSVPSFEFWYLLHFTYCTRAFNTCEEVIKELKCKQYIQDYEKSKLYIDILLPRLNQAINNAENIRQHNKDTETFCPSTDVDLVVQELQKMKTR